MKENNDLKNKTAAELKTILLELRSKIQAMRFKVAQRQLKKVHEIKAVKKQIARVLTYLADTAK